MKIVNNLSFLNTEADLVTNSNANRADVCAMLSAKTSKTWRCQFGMEQFMEEKKSKTIQFYSFSLEHGRTVQTIRLWIVPQLGLGSRLLALADISTSIGANSPDKCCIWQGYFMHFFLLQELQIFSSLWMSSCFILHLKCTLWSLLWKYCESFLSITVCFFLFFVFWVNLHWIKT